MQTIESETAKRLDELGLKRESYFCSFIVPAYNSHALLSCAEYEGSVYNKEDCERYPAYTLDEVLAMLPKGIRYHCLVDVYNTGDFKVSCVIDNYNICKEVQSKNPAEAAGQLLIWCIENGYVKTEELNDEL